MKKTTNRILSIFLATLLILSCFSVTAFAEQEKLSKSNVTQLPTIKVNVEGTEIPYGLSYEELVTINDDEIVLNAAGEQVPGHFEHYQPKTTWPMTVTKIRLKFIPDDTTAYSTFIYSNAIPVDFKVVKGELTPVDPNEPYPTASAVEFGSKLSESKFTGGKYQYEPYKKEYPGNWLWSNAQTIVTESGYYPAYIGSSVSTNQVFTDVWVEVIKTGNFTGIYELPTADFDIPLKLTLTFSQVPLVGGKAQYEGKDIAGHFEIIDTGSTAWVKPTDNPSYKIGQEVKAKVKFVPDDPTIAEAFTASEKIVEISMKVPDAKQIELADGVTEITMTYKQNSGYAPQFGGLAFKDGIPPEVVSVSIMDNSFRNKDVGTYQNVAVRFGDNVNRFYKSTTVNMTVRILPKPLDNPPAEISMVNVHDTIDPNQPADLFQISCRVPREDLHGKGIIRVNGEFVSEIECNPIGTRRVNYTVPKNGTYVVSFEYIPSEKDNYSFKNYTEQSYDIVLKVNRNITVVGGTADPAAALAGTPITAKIDGKTVTEANFNKWIATNAAGEVLPASALGVTDADLAKAELTFKMPDEDITLTAQTKKAITATGCIVEPANAAAGTVVTAKIDGDKVTEENFERWVITNSKGEEIPAADLGLSEEDLTKTEISFTMPDEDIKLTAKTNKTSCWENIKNFFGKVAQLPVISWIVTAVKFIVGLIVKVFKWMFSCIIK